MEESEAMERAIVIYERGKRLLEYAATNAASSADAGIVLCSALGLLLTFLSGKVNDKLTLSEIIEVFMRKRMEEESAAKERSER